MHTESCDVQRWVLEVCRLGAICVPYMIPDVLYVITARPDLALSSPDPTSHLQRPSPITKGAFQLLYEVLDELHF